MGQILSYTGAKSANFYPDSNPETNKRRRLSGGYSFQRVIDDTRLIPGLPDEISIQILARVPRIRYLNMKRVSRSWKAAVSGSEIYQVREELNVTEEWLYLLTKVEGDKFVWHGLDPVSGKWQRLPAMPEVDYNEDSKKAFFGFNTLNLMGHSLKLAELVKGLLGKKDGQDNMPFSGCAIGVVGGCLYVIGGFSKSTAMKCVWRYDPQLNSWSEMSPMEVGRGYCKTGVLNDKLYVVGGVNQGRAGLTPLQSAEVYDPKTDMWKQIPSMPFSRAQILPTAFLADMLKPIATGMTSYRGKLCVPQSLYSWPFFVDVGGEVFDPETNTWGEMANGMGDGWPARQAGTKLSVVVDGELYALDPSSSLDSGKIKKYDHQEDVWRVVLGRVPILDFTESEAPYLLAGIHGKLQVITKDANREIVILEADVKVGSCSSSSCSSSSSSSTMSKSSSGVSIDSDVGVEILQNEWRTVACKGFGSADLVCCQVLEL